MRKLNKKLAAALAAGAAVTLTAGGVAFAFWTGTGSGTGSASTAAGSSNLAVAQTSTLTAMYPGDSAQTLAGTVTNNGAEATYVTTVTASIAVTGAAGCDATDYTLSNAAMAVGADLAPGGSAPFSGATLQFNNKATNQDACKNATVTITYAVS